MSTALWSTSVADDMKMRLQQEVLDFGQSQRLPAEGARQRAGQMP